MSLHVGLELDSIVITGDEARALLLDARDGNRETFFAVLETISEREQVTEGQILFHVADAFGRNVAHYVTVHSINQGSLGKPVPKRYSKAHKGIH